LGQKFKVGHRPMNEPTPEEKKLASTLKDAGIPIDTTKRFWYYSKTEQKKKYIKPDICIPALNLAIEVDGNYHTGTAEQSTTDRLRARTCRKAGYEVQHIHNNLINNPQQLHNLVQNITTEYEHKHGIKTLTPSRTLTSYATPIGRTSDTPLTARQLEKIHKEKKEREAFLAGLREWSGTNAPTSSSIKPSHRGKRRLSFGFTDTGTQILMAIFFFIVIWISSNPQGRIFLVFVTLFVGGLLALILQENLKIWLYCYNGALSLFLLIRLILLIKTIFIALF